MIFKTKKYWIGVAVFWIPWLVLCVVCYLFVLQPQTRQYKTVHADFTASNDRVSIARLSSFEDTQKRQQEMLAELQSRVSEFVVPAEQHDRIVFEISRLANSFGLADYAGKNRQDIWNTDEDEEVKVQRMWMTITFKAPFQQFAAFLNAMERNVPAVFIESAGIERSRENPNQHRAKLLIAFFTQPEKSADTAVTAAKQKTEEGPLS